jgi:general secretion pathway protein D
MIFATLAALLLPALGPSAASPAASPALPRSVTGSPALPQAQAPAANAAPGATRADQEGGKVPPIQAQGDFFIINFSEDQNEATSLEQFVKVCQQATGLNFMISPDSDAQLKQGKVRMFGTKRIPKKDFYSFFQIILFINDFACIRVGRDPLSVIVIQQLTQASPRSAVKQRAEYVLPDELDRYADEPATLITTVVTLPNTNVRDLSNSLRALTPDQATQNMLPAGSSDSLILTGFGSNIWQLAELLYLINEKSAVPEPILPVFDRIKLEFADAEDAADIVEQLLEARREAEQQALQNRAPDAQPARAQNATSAKIIVEKRTNSLFVMAMPDELPSIKELIARIDTEVLEPERNYHIYALENVNAEDLADALTQFLEDARSLTQASTGTGTGGQTRSGAAGSDSAEDVVVVADPTTNSLLIAANKTRYAEVLTLIQALDQRADQVLIETALIELSGSDFLDLGVELGFADIGADTGGFGVTSFGLSTLEDLDNDGIVDTRVPTITNGITGGIIDAGEFSLPVLISALKTRSDANVLNIPSILVNNNSTATVGTLEERPTTQVTAFGGAGGGQTQENFNNYQEAGITLTISPSISASRYLRLNIELNVSNFLGQGSGTIPPPRVTRNILTTVNVPDGDTMVIGGVITDNNSFDRQQTPLLGDLPLIGFLFRRDTRDASRRTLYFFVTPHILADEDFGDLAELSYKKKLDASRVIGAGRVRMIDEDFEGSARPDADLPGFELPLYQTPPAGEMSAEELGMDPEELMESQNQSDSDPSLPATPPATGG